MDLNDLESYVTMLSQNLGMVDGLPDEVVEELIKYLESEIANKQKILEKLENELL